MGLVGWLVGYHMVPCLVCVCVCVCVVCTFLILSELVTSFFLGTNVFINTVFSTLDIVHVLPSE
jgi:hypothetical protein